MQKPALVRVVFSIEKTCKDPTLENVGIVGSTDCLGNWDVDKAATTSFCGLQSWIFEDWFPMDSKIEFQLVLIAKTKIDFLFTGQDVGETKDARVLQRETHFTRQLNVEQDNLWTSMVFGENGHQVSLAHSHLTPTGQPVRTAELACQKQGLFEPKQIGWSFTEMDADMEEAEFNRVDVAAVNGVVFTKVLISEMEEQRREYARNAQKAAQELRNKKKEKEQQEQTSKHRDSIVVEEMPAAVGSTTEHRPGQNQSGPLDEASSGNTRSNYMKFVLEKFLTANSVLSMLRSKDHQCPPRKALSDTTLDTGNAYVTPSRKRLTHGPSCASPKCSTTCKASECMYEEVMHDTVSDELPTPRTQSSFLYDRETFQLDLLGVRSRIKKKPSESGEFDVDSYFSQTIIAYSTDVYGDGLSSKYDVKTDASEDELDTDTDDDDLSDTESTMFGPLFETDIDTGAIPKSVNVDSLETDVDINFTVNKPDVDVQRQASLLYHRETFQIGRLGVSSRNKNKSSESGEIDVDSYFSQTIIAYSTDVYGDGLSSKYDVKTDASEDDLDTDTDDDEFSDTESTMFGPLFETDIDTGAIPKSVDSDSLESVVDLNVQEKPDVDLNIQETPDVGLNIQETPEVDSKFKETPDVGLKIQETPDVGLNIQETPEVASNIQEKSDVDLNLQEKPDFDLNLQEKPDFEFKVDDFDFKVDQYLAVEIFDQETYIDGLKEFQSLTEVGGLFDDLPALESSSESSSQSSSESDTDKPVIPKIITIDGETDVDAALVEADNERESSSKSSSESGADKPAKTITLDGETDIDAALVDAYTECGSTYEWYMDAEENDDDGEFDVDLLMSGSYVSVCSGISSGSYILEGTDKDGVFVFENILKNISFDDVASITILSDDEGCGDNKEDDNESMGQADLRASRPFLGAKTSEQKTASWLNDPLNNVAMYVTNKTLEELFPKDTIPEPDSEPMVDVNKDVVDVINKDVIDVNKDVVEVNKDVFHDVINNPDIYFGDIEPEMSPISAPLALLDAVVSFETDVDTRKRIFLDNRHRATEVVYFTACVLGAVAVGAIIMQKYQP